jgi:N-acetylglucosamine-6-phosphate deacetylase
MTQSPENITKALVAIKEYMELNPETGSKVLGVHLEGPFISPDFIGAQPLEYVAKPDVNVFKKYQDASGDNIRVVSLAPEEEGSKELIKYLKENGIVASIGHTNSKHADILAGIEAGLTNVTHTFNAQKPLHHREIGTVGSALLFDELNCELICDTIHVCVPAIKLVVKSKPHNKVTLITDAMRAKHMPDGDYELGGQPVIVKNGEARLHNGTLAGSVLRMNHAVRNVHKLAGIELTHVLDMASLNPAQNLGVSEERGSIKVGKYADFAVLDENFEVVMTIAEGRIIYQR